MIRKKLIFFTLVFLVLSMTFVSPAYGFFGQHRTCPRCGGLGRDPATLFLTSCPTCGGDGEVGIFMDNEDLEDSLSFLFVGVIIIIVIAGAVASSKKPATPTRRCKFCGAKIDEQANFCPVCNRSQK